MNVAVMLSWSVCISALSSLDIYCVFSHIDPLCVVCLLM